MASPELHPLYHYKTYVGGILLLTKKHYNMVLNRVALVFPHCDGLITTFITTLTDCQLPNCC